MSNTQSIRERIDADLKQAMRDRDALAKLTIRSIKAAITEANKVDVNHTVTDDEVLKIVQKEAKKRRDTAAEYEKLGHADRAETELAELAIIERYLPQQLSEAELEVIVQATIDEIGASSMREMGKVMSAVMPKVTGVADGKMVNQVAKKLLTA